MVAIGFWGVGSITSATEVGNTVEKGEYMGHFGYGGSSIVLAFEPNLDFNSQSAKTLSAPPTTPFS